MAPLAPVRTMIFFELVGTVQSAECGDRVLQHLVIGDRRRADQAGGGLDVLLLDGIGDVIGRDAESRHALRIEPDAHGIVERAHAGWQSRRRRHEKAG